jgi:hypothetical protein
LVDLRRTLHGQRLVRGWLLKISINLSKRARLQNIGGQAIANFASTETADSLWEAATRQRAGVLAS